MVAEFSQGMTSLWCLELSEIEAEWTLLMQLDNLILVDLCGSWGVLWNFMKFPTKATVIVMRISSSTCKQLVMIESWMVTLCKRLKNAAESYPLPQLSLAQFSLSLSPHCPIIALMARREKRLFVCAPRFATKCMFFGWWGSLWVRTIRVSVFYRLGWSMMHIITTVTQCKSWIVGGSQLLPHSCCRF